MVHTVFTDSTYLTSYGYYTSNIGISTANGANLTLNIEGHYGSTSGDAAPFSYNFSINQDSSTLPYSQIGSSDSLTKALEIASISYFSEVANAKIIVTSDAGGQFVDFKFTADDPPRKTFPFFLAFQSTLHAPTTVYALTEDTCISTKKITHVDKKGRETYTYELGGDIKLYIGQDTIMPATGTYRSTIYFTIEPADTI